MIFEDEYFFEDIKSKIPSLEKLVLLFPVKGERTSFVMIMPALGSQTKIYTNSVRHLSIISQDPNPRVARENAMLIYNLYHEKFNVKISLGVGYKPEISNRSIIAKYIQAVDYPVPLGDQGNGRYQYSLNFMIQLKEAS